MNHLRSEVRRRQRKNIHNISDGYEQTNISSIYHELKAKLNGNSSSFNWRSRVLRAYTEFFVTVLKSTDRIFDFNPQRPRTVQCLYFSELD